MEMAAGIVTLVTGLASLARALYELYGVLAEHGRLPRILQELLQRVPAVPLPGLAAFERRFEWMLPRRRIVLAFSSGLAAAAIPLGIFLIVIALQPEPRVTVQITDPADGSQVGEKVEVQGTYSNVPSDQDIWVIVQPQLAPRFHPQLGPALRREREWSAVAYLGEDPPQGTSEKLDIIVVLATRDASRAFNDYLDEAEKKGSFPGLHQLPEGVEIKDRATVIRGGNSVTPTPEVSATAIPTVSPTPTPTPGNGDTPEPPPRTVTPPPTPTRTPSPTPMPTPLGHIVLEGENGTGDGEVLARSSASGQRTIWLHDGEFRSLPFRLPADATYTLSVRYSNDNFGPLESVDVKVDSVSVGQFAALDTGDYGHGWNVFESTGAIGSVSLQAGVHQVEVFVTGGDGYGVEIDVVELVRVG